MVHVTRTLSLITYRERVNVFFDKSLQIPSIEKICKNSSEADSFIESKYAWAIRTALIKFAKQQLYIANKYPAMKGASVKVNSANLIFDEMIGLAGKPLILVTASVYWLRNDIYNLRPGKTSRYRKYYDTVISPTVDLCFNHSRKRRLAMMKAEPGSTTCGPQARYSGSSVPETHIRT